MCENLHKHFEWTTHAFNFSGFQTLYSAVFQSRLVVFLESSLSNFHQNILSLVQGDENQVECLYRYGPI
jgi:hypothetical protein